MERFGGIKRASIAAGHSGSRAEVAMNMKQLFGAGIKGLHLGVRYRPGGRDAALVPDLAKIFRAHAEHGGAEHFGLSSHEVRLLRVQLLTVFVLPDFFGVITVVEKNS